MESERVDWPPVSASRLAGQPTGTGDWSTPMVGSMPARLDHRHAPGSRQRHLPPVAVGHAGSDDARLSLRPELADCHPVMQLRHRGHPMSLQKAGNEGRPGDDNRKSGSHRDPPAHPNSPAPSNYLRDRRRPRLDTAQRVTQPGAEFVFVLDAHAAPPSRSTGLVRSFASARDAWLFTFPTEQPSTYAVSVSERSSQYLSTTAARWP